MTTATKTILMPHEAEKVREIMRKNFGRVLRYAPLTKGGRPHFAAPGAVLLGEPEEVICGADDFLVQAYREVRRFRVGETVTEGGMRRIKHECAKRPGAIHVLDNGDAVIMLPDGEPSEFHL